MKGRVYRPGAVHEGKIGSNWFSHNHLHSVPQLATGRRASLFRLWPGPDTATAVAGTIPAPEGELPFSRRGTRARRVDVHCVRAQLPRMNEQGQTTSHGARFVVVLNRTQDVVNIATSLRAMMNTGLTRLRLVRPDDFNAYRIAGIAHGSEPLIEQIEFFDSLDDATADTSLVIGTTARRRTATYLWSHPREAAPDLLGYAAAPDRPVAIVFGREDTGLLNEELDLCDRLLVVPTSEINSSLNLSQAVLLIGYELMLAATPSDRELPRPRRDMSAANALQMRALFEQSAAALSVMDFFKGKNPEAIMRTLRAVLRRAEMTSREATLFRAMAIETQKAFGRQPLMDALMRRGAAVVPADEDPDAGADPGGSAGPAVADPPDGADPPAGADGPAGRQG